MDIRCQSVIAERSAGAFGETSPSWDERVALAKATARAAEWFTAQAPAPAADLSPLVDRMQAIAAAARLELAQEATHDEAAFQAAWTQELSAWAHFIVAADRAGIAHCANILVLTSSAFADGNDADLALDRSLTYANWWCSLRGGHLPEGDRAVVVDRIRTSLTDVANRPGETFSIELDGQTETVGAVGAMITDALHGCPHLPTGDPDGAALAMLLALAGGGSTPA